MKECGQACALCRVPEGKKNHTASLPSCTFFDGVSLSVGVSAKQFLGVVTQVTPRREDLRQLLRCHGPLGAESEVFLWFFN